MTYIESNIFDLTDVADLSLKNALSSQSHKPIVLLDTAPDLPKQSPDTLNVELPELSLGSPPFPPYPTSNEARPPGSRLSNNNKESRNENIPKNGENAVNFDEQLKTMVTLPKSVTRESMSGAHDEDNPLEAYNNPGQHSSLGNNSVFSSSNFRSQYNTQNFQEFNTQPLYYPQPCYQPVQIVYAPVGNGIKMVPNSPNTIPVLYHNDTYYNGMNLINGQGIASVSQVVPQLQLFTSGENVYGSTGNVNYSQMRLKSQDTKTVNNNNNENKQDKNQVRINNDKTRNNKNNNENNEILNREEKLNNVSTNYTDSVDGSRQGRLNVKSRNNTQPDLRQEIKNIQNPRTENIKEEYGNRYNQVVVPYGIQQMGQIVDGYSHNYAVFPGQQLHNLNNNNNVTNNDMQQQQQQVQQTQQTQSIFTQNKLNQNFQSQIYPNQYWDKI